MRYAARTDVLAWIAVAAGGALGSVARHAVNRLVNQHWPSLRFPLATLLVNLIGCAVIGALAGLVTTGHWPARGAWRELVFVGILGGFTTFSAFGLDMVTLLRAGATAQALANVLLQVAGGVAAVYGGLALVERIGRAR
jgi:CrcB protein